MRRLIVIFIFSVPFFALPISGQVQNLKYQDLDNTILTIFDSAKNCTSDSTKELLMVHIQNLLNQRLIEPESFAHSFKTLKTIGEIYAPENQLRILTWNMFLNDNTTKNYGIIQLNPHKEKECKIYILENNSNMDSIGNSELTFRTWYGALYYKILSNKVGNREYFTLLGYNVFSPMISKKIIDILYFDEKGNLILGAPLINVSGKLQSRLIFSYSARLSVMLNYDESLQMILFDHLSPSEPRYTGQFEFYGPDFSYDGLIFKQGQWQFISNIKSLKSVRKK
jgi:hypothetical protein